jgi:hypothetical protein
VGAPGKPAEQGQRRDARRSHAASGRGAGKREKVAGKSSVTLGYTAGYLLIGLEPIRLCTYIVQVLMGRREAVVV